MKNPFELYQDPGSFCQITLCKNKSNLEIDYAEGCFYPKINQVLEKASTGVLPIITLILVSLWHRGFTLFLFLFLWPLVLLYGYRHDEDTYFELTLGLSSLYSLILISILGWSIFPIVDQFVLVWLLEIVHTGFLMGKILLKKKISEGYHRKSMIYALLFTLISEIFYISLFLSNNFIVASPNLLTFGLFLKVIVLLRAKYG